MKDTEVVPALVSFGAFILAHLFVTGITDTISSRMKYQAFATAQANVLACRQSKLSPVQADQICGPVPNIKNFNLQ